MGFRIVDLSQEIFDGMPVYPGNQRTGVFPNKTHAETAKAYANSPSGHTSTTNCLIMSDHGPTHVDAFYHIDKDGETIDQLGLSNGSTTKAICLDLSRFCNTEDWMEPADLEEASARRRTWTCPTREPYSSGRATTRRTTAGIFIIGCIRIRALSEAAMTWLADRGCINVGIDSPSVDSSRAFTDKGYWAHKACRERKVLNVENLANLKEVVNTKFIFSCLPLKIREGTGSPVRAVAIYHD